MPYPPHDYKKQTNTKQNNISSERTKKKETKSKLIFRNKQKRKQKDKIMKFKDVAVIIIN